LTDESSVAEKATGALAPFASILIQGDGALRAPAHLQLKRAIASRLRLAPIMSKVSPFPSLFPDLEEAALREGLHDLLAAKVERFVHVCIVASASGPRLQRWQISPFQSGDTTHFIAIPGSLSDASAGATALGAALREAVVNRLRIESRCAGVAPSAEQPQVRLKRVQLGGRSHLLAFPADLPEPPAAERLLFAQEQERHRVAIELHDSTSQHLVAVGLGLARLRRFVRARPAERQMIEQVSRALQDAIREVRTFSFLMNPPQLERDRLKAAAARFLAGFESRTGVATRLVVGGDPDASSMAVQHTLFRLLQETLSDIYRHAKAAHVNVTLVRRAGWITLTIGDDALRGIDDVDQLIRAPIGVGIAGMHAPVVQLGGSLKVLHGADGQKVVARLPGGAMESPGAPKRRRRPRPLQREH
jgi:signal transduction histidine kinase